MLTAALALTLSKTGIAHTTLRGRWRIFMSQVGSTRRDLLPIPLAGAGYSPLCDPFHQSPTHPPHSHNGSRCCTLKYTANRFAVPPRGQASMVSLLGSPTSDTRY
jgi:hypothetical protein